MANDKLLFAEIPQVKHYCKKVEWKNCYLVNLGEKLDWMRLIEEKIQAWKVTRDCPRYNIAQSVSIRYLV